MIFSLSVWLILAFVLTYCFDYVRSLRRNLALAKESGFNYVVTPVFYFNRKWLIVHRMVLPLLHKLPKQWTHPWLTFLDPEWTWQTKFDAFEMMGSDIFLIVSPGNCTLMVANAEAHTQITNRRNDFPKPLELYRTLDLFGKNVVTTEGSIWRYHRKITSPPFNERNNHLVWSESLHQAQAMVEDLSARAGGNKTDFPCADLAEESMTLSLHVISRAGFGVQMKWPEEELRDHGESNAVPEGHTMTFKQSMVGFLENIIQFIILPRWFIRNSPLKKQTHAWKSFSNWNQYLHEIYESKKDEVRTGTGSENENLDLMGAFVKGAGITQESLTASDAEKGGNPGNLLSDDEILGNLFVFIIAGHETSANSIHFGSLYLAMYPEAQASMQKEVDEMFGTRPFTEWDYEKDITKLFTSYVGAVLAEQLRLVPPVINIPKHVPSESAPQPLTLDRKRYTVPSGTHVNLITPATHRNPKYWPTPYGENATPGQIKHDLNSFRPDRWLISSPSSSEKPSSSNTQSAAEAYLGDQAHFSDTSSPFRPLKGSYIPFSEGHRSCLGRRFAQVQVLAVLALLFREYSVELDVSAFASDAEVDAMSRKERKVVWDKAWDRSQDLLDHGMSTILTIKMRRGKVPLRFVKRGTERFKGFERWVEV